MTKSKFILPAMLVAAALGGAGTLALPAQPAQAQAANPAPQGAPPPARPRPMRQRESHIEGRIAYLKAELKITPAQEAQFDKLAQAMRQNDAERRRAFEEARTDRGQAQHNAMQLLERRARFSAMRAQQTERTLAAFRPLYDSLSPEQKKAADDLAMPHFHGRHRGRI